MKRLLIVALCLVLSACSLFKEKVEEPKSLTRVSANLEIKERWDRQVGKGLGELYRLVKPVVVDDTVYANDIYGRIYAFNKDTGARKWLTNLKMELSSGVGFGGSLLLIGSLNGDVVALSPVDGAEVWRVNIASEILAPPQTNGKVVIVQTNEGKIFGLDILTGDFLWRYSAKLPLLTIRGTATPQLFGNNLITGFANGKIVAFSAEDGVVFWERRIAYPQGRTEIERVVDVDGTPLVHGSTVYSTSFNGHLTAIAPDGRLRWTQKVSSHQSPLVIGERIFVTASDGVVHAFDARTGLPLWDNALLKFRRLSAPQNVAGFLVVADFRGFLHVFDPEIGVIIARDRFDSEGVRSPMVSDGEYLYLLGNDGELSSISLHLRGSREQIDRTEREEKREALEEATNKS